ncbi:MAG: phosphoenolpyruvate carboxylase [Francisellaceae bacterium]|jgi:phosphoenolpyruvate carboxylase|nr:phosphoenolpyruvate carboxylase [Francisellaceae bacterium]MBT6539053.1 phosphoenolpyruvate carboxylase [Francisellaceae bacterium]
MSTINQPLKDDIRLLGNILGKVIREQVGDQAYGLLEEVRKLAKLISKGDKEKLELLVNICDSLDETQTMSISRSFLHFLNFTNIAEQYHRVRRTRLHQKLADYVPQPGSFSAFFNHEENTTNKVFEKIKTIKIGLVLTAHPTEVKRRTLMHKYRGIYQCLEVLDTDPTPCETENIVDDIYAKMTSIWQTEDSREQRPSPIDEAKWGFAVIESSIWYAIAKTYRALDKEMQLVFGKSLPLDTNIIDFGAWMGGDRDGNPNVNSKTTFTVCWLSRWVSANLFLKDIANLIHELSMSVCNENLRQIVGATQSPYRDLLKSLRRKLANTKLYIEEITNFQNSKTSIDPSSCCLETKDLLEPLMLCYQSLIDCGAKIVATGALQDTIRRVHCFGLHLQKLDIRQESSRHNELLSVITKELGLGDYLNWSEQERIDFLSKEIQQNRPLIPRGMKLSEDNAEVLNTFKILSQIPRENLGSYIISMASMPSDILLVLCLQKECGMKNPLPIVPLFETYSDLENAPSTIDRLLSLDWYKDRIGDSQEVMIGYSDSTKDSGILAASWAQFQSQEQLVIIGKKHNINILFFHGRGGSTGRGGWPTHTAITSQPPNSILDKLRVTVQGEVIDHRFGMIDTAQRNLTVYITSTLESILKPSQPPSEQHRKLMAEMATISKEVYTNSIKESQDFMDYFVKITPLGEIGKMAISSRPAKRKNISSFDSLRAIPWVFSWTQNRLLLTSWFGIKSAIESIKDQDRLSQIQEMSKSWGFFHNLLSMCEMVFAKVNTDIFDMYQNKLCTNDFNIDLINEYNVTKNLVLEVLEQEVLLEKDPVLLRTIDVRAPYILPLHILQIKLLHHKREQGKNFSNEAQKALVTTIMGIVAGMKNTG